MANVHRFLSLLTAGALTLSSIPTAGALGLNLGASANANANASADIEAKANSLLLEWEANGSIDAQASAEIRAACMDEEGRQKYLCVLRHLHHHVKKHVRDECEDITDPEDRRECVKELREDVREELKEKHPNWKRGWAHLRGKVRSEVKERCEEFRGMPEQMRNCRKLLKPAFRLSAEERAKLQACMQLGTAEERRACVTRVRAEIKADTSVNN